ncbi:bifunctional (p)ppGpp synthetase/guanosine-3',5'-bis(diphosphate) 3'-pyrophosphohydrolase [Alkalibacter rhizosphaerae]|uniref:GTP diphosphokinase n=1 Tax=Alkalibacter rhizosphaerae TaxID=2815577 RepID=A0A974XFB2_9FIRM|nr:bifunctional (p)ppGpp synthetase/guanosine-3',5'-bis(diphosphate) 3'-pyrophosphohydrolase [Alkalibacter rhizosphaerae]QSX08773.1 bifunctional (p)ppGpp synthetase/guanosine-3',5'-bis(diphosphate) 3'-pyrophosphohydrolase [Alkalibacter rhizosphaerae]
MNNKLIAKVLEYNKDADVSILQKAYDLAVNAHQGQKRVSGDDYIIHPLEVAMILAELQLDVPTIAAAILHDVVEDTQYSYEDMQREFGDEIAELVDGVTKISKLEFKSKEEQQAESLRKMIIAMAKDIRVIMIKLADRLHNMRTLKYMPEDKQKAKAQETLDIYSPIAHRLGISKIKWELEDISLRYLDEKGYYDLVSKVAQKREVREAYIQNVIEILKEKLEEVGIEADIQGRPKHFYSIYRKMYVQNRNFEEIYDLIAVRIIVNNIKDCYGVLGVAHTMWKPIPGRFKDYIAMPKPNMYQSLHTTVIGPKGDPFEIQIRTWEMHRTAEFGIAAHWKYKEGIEESDNFEEKLVWLRQIMEWQRELQDASEFMETLKVDLFTDEVFVFTPKGDVIQLPKGSCPLDFAYRVHSDVGNKCIGAKINGKIVPLNYTLQNGDIVEVLTSAHSNGPSRDWLKIVKSSHARNKIKQYFKKDKKEENVQKGRDMLEKEVKRQGLQQANILKQTYLEFVAKKSNYNSVEDLYSAIGYGGIKPNFILQKIKNQFKSELNLVDDQAILDEFSGEAKQQKPVIGQDKLEKAVKVSGFKNMAVRFSKCCNPVPGDKIIGYITRGRGVSVHRADCANIRNADDVGRLIDVEWVKYTVANFTSEIHIKAKDTKGLLTKVTTVISDQNISIVSLNVRTDQDYAYFTISFEVKSTRELNMVIKKLHKIPEIENIYRA